jgi:hypothetical protein
VRLATKNSEGFFLAFDLQQLRQQYSELTDEALLEINRDELVDAARECYDDELVQRRLRPAKRTTSATDAGTDSEVENGEEPDWLQDGMAAMSAVGGEVSVVDAKRVLDRAGITCFIVDREPEKPGEPGGSDLLVPPGQHLLALSVLDRDFFNPQTEADWKNHFEALNDQELLEIDADLLVAGMRDRIERLVRAYEDELLKRGLAELETSSD